MARDLLHLAFGALGRTLLLGHFPDCSCPTCLELHGDAGRLAAALRGAAAEHTAADLARGGAAPAGVVVPAEVIRPERPAVPVLTAQVVSVRPVGSAEESAKRPRGKRSKGKASASSPRALLGDGSRAPSPVRRGR